KLIFLRNDSALFHMFVIAFLVSSILLNTASLSCWNFWDTTSLIRSVIVLKNAFISSQLSYINLAMIPIGPVMIARIVVPHFLKKSDIPFQMETDIFLIPSHTSVKKSLMPFHISLADSAIASQISASFSLISSQLLYT